MQPIFTSPHFTRAVACVSFLFLFIGSLIPARSQTLPCDAARVETHAGSSACTGCEISNPAYAVDDNMISASSLVLLPLGSGAYVQQTLHFSGASSQGDSIYLYLSFLSAIMDVNVLKNIQLATYNGTTYNNDRAAVAAPAFRIQFLTAEQVVVKWAPSKTFDRLELRLANSQSTPLLRVNVHYANRGNAAPALPSSTVTICSGSATVIQPSSAPGTSLQWYTEPSGGCPFQTGPQFTTPVLTDTATYYIATAKGACVTAQRTSVTVNVQPGIKKQWDKTYGGSKYDDMRVMLPVSNGRYFLAGTTQSQDGNVTNPRSGNRAWVTKVGGLGGILWNKTYSNNAYPNYYGQTVLSAMIPVDSSKFLLGGMVDYWDYSYKAWVAKIDSNGNQLWERSFYLGTSTTIDFKYVKLTSVVMASDGGYLLGGYANKDTTYPNDDTDNWIIKIDGSGNLQWQKIFAGSAYDYLECILPTADGGYLLGGSSASSDGAVGDGNNGLDDFWLLKITATGDKVWDKTYGGSGSEKMERILQTSDGGLLLGGTTSSPAGGDVTKGALGNDIWLVRTDANGNKLWDNTLGAPLVGCRLHTMLATDDGFLLGGSTNAPGNSGDITDAGNGDLDFLILKVDAQGKRMWDKTLGGSEADELYSLVPAADGGIYAGGFTKSPRGGDLTEENEGLTDAWLVKLLGNNCSQLGTAATAKMDNTQTFAATAASMDNKANEQQTVLKAFPNPFTQQLQLRYTVRKTGRVSLQLYDMQGKQIASLKDAVVQAGVYNETIDGSNFTSGSYICRLLLDGSMYSETVIRL